MRSIIGTRLCGSTSWQATVRAMLTRSGGGMDQTSCSVADWHASLRARSTGDTTMANDAHRASIAAFGETPAEVVQPALFDDVLCLHRGGAKRVHRVRDGRRDSFDVERDSLTLLQRGQSARWRTEGPIDYIHLTIGAAVFAEIVQAESGLSRLDVQFADQVGFADPLLASLMIEMLQICAAGDESQLYYDTLLTSLILALVRRASARNIDRAAGATANGIKGGLAGWRLRAVLEFIAEHRATDISFSSLVHISGLSRAHFYRAFQQSTGLTPGQYLERLRVEDARRAIERGMATAELAAATGFSSQAALTRAFRRTLMVTPDAYRRCVR
ncbi:helix-turn-helix transcriptional regulator [Sphingomonas suaedae]|uniref:Helix-turn-helix transcriptional regulator n=1 Tax=Sphingomonas suaedae TaxID=2599297 RepID=A0A518RHK0_9SPHN|nr:AraC family transcriptional regulator [Sphingomonas suaedae]QDX26916.1 helix-turn-helix transcriptional regulator [Sphingomonas suaedae]